jgi:hypothetical protein
VPEADYRCVSFANVVAGELGMFGLRPEVPCHLNCSSLLVNIAACPQRCQLSLPAQDLVDLSPSQLQVLSDALAGKRVEVAVNESAYWRSFGGDQSPEDLETALQLVYRCVRVVGSALCPTRLAAGTSDVLTSYNVSALQAVHRTSRGCGFAIGDLQTVSRHFSNSGGT